MCSPLQNPKYFLSYKSKLNSVLVSLSDCIVSLTPIYQITTKLVRTSKRMEEPARSMAAPHLSLLQIWFFFFRYANGLSHLLFLALSPPNPQILIQIIQTKERKKEASMWRDEENRKNYWEKRRRRKGKKKEVVVKKKR